MNYEQYMVTVPFGACGQWRVDPWEVDGRIHRRLLRGGVTVMTDTPDEVDAHLPAITRARGRVMMSGLGLGMLLKACLAKPEVASVDVIERDPDVIALIAPHYEDPRLHIHYEDVFTFPLVESDQWDVVWHDIWDDADHDRTVDIATLLARYHPHAVWQGVWKWDS